MTADINELCGPFLEKYGLTARHVYPIGPGFLDCSLIEFRDRNGDELSAYIEISDEEPELKDGSLRSFDVNYELLSDGSQFELFELKASSAFDQDGDLGEQVARFLEANMHRKRRQLTGDVHRDKVFYQACLAVDELRSELGLSTRTFKKGHVRSQLSFATEDGRNGELYMSAGRLRFEFDGQEKRTLDYPDAAAIKSTVSEAIRQAIGSIKTGPRK